jgi:hypothetical protein
LRQVEGDLMAGVEALRRAERGLSDLEFAGTAPVPAGARVFSAVKAERLKALQQETERRMNDLNTFRRDVLTQFDRITTP